MKAWACVLAAAVGLSLAGPAAAQLPAAGARSLRLATHGQTQVGLWMMRTERTAVGVEAGLSLSRQSMDGSDESATEWSVSAAPSLKRYGAAAGPFAPYLFAGLPLEFRRYAISSVEHTGLTLGAVAAVGVDWFPASRVALGAHAGLRAQRDSWTLGSDGAAYADGSNSHAGTFASGLSLHLFF